MAGLSEKENYLQRERLLSSSWRNEKILKERSFPVRGSHGHIFKLDAYTKASELPTHYALNDIKLRNEIFKFFTLC